MRGLDRKRSGVGGTAELEGPSDKPYSDAIGDPSSKKEVITGSAGLQRRAYFMHSASVKLRISGGYHKNKKYRRKRESQRGQPVDCR